MDPNTDTPDALPAITWDVRDSDGGRWTVTATTVLRALLAAESDVLRHSADSDSTQWTTVWVSHEADGVDECRRVVVVHPEEPDCSADAHEWEDDGVRANAGGVIVRETCAHCGVSRITDTWAQRPDTGEEGLTSVHYEAADANDE